MHTIHLSSSESNNKPHPVKEEEEEEQKNASTVAPEWQLKNQQEPPHGDVSSGNNRSGLAASAAAERTAAASPNIKKRRAPVADHGSAYFPDKAAQPVEDKAPQALDHFKRGYQERAELRQKESSNMHNKRFHHHNEGGGGGGGGAGPGGGGRGGEGRASGGGGGRYSRRDSDDGRNRGDLGGGGGGGGGGGDSFNLHGFNATDFVDRTFQKVSSMNQQQAEAVVDEELHKARSNYQEAFVSGKAMTALIATAARRRHIRLAHHFWEFMDRANLPKNIFHYNAMISVTEKDKNLRQALDLLKEMKERGIEKNEVT